MSSAGLDGCIDYCPAVSSQVGRQILCRRSRTSPPQMRGLAQIDHANRDCLAQNNDSEADFVELVAVKIIIASYFRKNIHNVGYY